MQLSRFLSVAMLLTMAFISNPSRAADAPAKDGWFVLFDGKTYDNWKISEKPETWTIKEGALWAHGDRSHIFYMGALQPFTNFEFHAEVLTRSNSNGGIFIHTKFQPDGWPAKGFECQVNNTFVKDPIKTASVYQVKNITTAPAKDDEWFNYDIIVKGKTITIKINDKVINEYTEPAGKVPDANFSKILDHGTFALQGHDPGSTVGYRNIRVKPLP